MKTLVTILGLLLILLAMIGASLRAERDSQMTRSEVDCGYTIIEFGKGIDCHGDTVALVKVLGGQKLAIN